jgi:hypothetical protein
MHGEALFMRKLLVFGVVALALAGCTSAATTTPDVSSMSNTRTAQSTGQSPQIILSATGITTTKGPAGFWLWSQTGGNAYGNGGQGSMYFYQVYRTTVPVEVSEVVLSGKTVTEDVISKDGRINCEFSATQTSPTGSPNGKVSFTCTHPAGASATNVPAKVNIAP